VCSMYFRQSTQRQPSAWKVTHEARHLTLFPSTRVTRQWTGTLSTHHFRRTISPYHGVSRIEFQFCCLRTRFGNNSVFCLHSVDFGVSWTFTVIFLNDSRGSTLFVRYYRQIYLDRPDPIVVCIIFLGGT
jgi:hypothetical protein